MKLTHYDEKGVARMVDISHKALSRRTASAEGRVKISSRTAELVKQLQIPKGNPLEVARLAGIQAAKRTSELIPLCHNLHLDHVDVQIELQDDHFLVRASARCRWATGVEMEALTAVSVAALTLYDMCKAVDSKMEITGIRLLEKTREPVETGAASQS
jgi:cyclic pyranopterin phosphate synthase